MSGVDGKLGGIRIVADGGIMAGRVTVSRTRVERELAAVVAGQWMAGEEPTAEAVEAARKVLEGRQSADDAIREGFAALRARHQAAAH